MTDSSSSPDEIPIPVDHLTGEPYTGVALAMWQIGQYALDHGKAIHLSYTMSFETDTPAPKECP